MDNKKLGIICMIIASLSFALMSVMVKLSGGKIPLFQQVFFRNFIMLIFTSFMLYKNKTSIKVENKNRLPLFFRCFLGFLGVICVFYSNNHMPLANAQVLQKLNPFFVTLFATFILNEKLTSKKLASVFFGFLGAYIIINPSGNFNLYPSLVGILSALFGGLAYMMIRKMKGRVNGMVIIFYFSLFSFIASFPLMISNFVNPNIKVWVFLLLIGVFAAFGQYFITKAYLNAPASEISIFDYTGVVFSPLLGLIIFSESINLRVIIGMIIIICAGYYASRLKK